MNSPISLDLPADHQFNQTTTEERRIHVQNATGGFSMISHRILARAFRDLTGAEIYVFLFVWEQTVAFRQFLKSIPIAKFVDSISYSERSIWDALSTLQAKGWLTTQANGNNPQLYGVSLQLLEEAGILLSDKPEETDTTESCKDCTPLSPAPLTIQDLRSKRKKKNPIPLLPDTIPDPKSKEVAVLDEEGLGGVLFSNQTTEEESFNDMVKVNISPLDRILEKYPGEEARAEGVFNKLKACGIDDIESCFRWDLDIMCGIIREFELHCLKPHNIISFPGVLWSWLQRGFFGYNEKPVINTVKTLPPELVDLQKVVDQKFEQEELYDILPTLQDYGQPRGYTVRELYDKLDMHSAGFHELDWTFQEWRRSNRQEVA